MLGLFILVFAWTASSNGQQLPSSFKRCPGVDSENNPCLKTAVLYAIVILSDNGAPDLGAEKLDPLNIPQIELKQGGAVDVNIQFKNSQLTGFRGLNVECAGGNISSPENFSFKAVGYAPLLVLTGPYNIKGRVLILPINGQGRSNLTMINVKAELRVKGSQDQKNGKIYLKINSVKLIMRECKRMYFDFKGLFNNDKRLGDNTNNFLNANWEIIYNELKPAISTSFSKVFEDYTKKIMENVPYYDMLMTS